MPNAVESFAYIAKKNSPYLRGALRRLKWNLSWKIYDQYERINVSCDEFLYRGLIFSVTRYLCLAADP